MSNVIALEPVSEQLLEAPTLDIQKCSSCGLGNFNMWGTVIDDSLRIEVRCMRCGRINYSLDNNSTAHA